MGDGKLFTTLTRESVLEYLRSKHAGHELNFINIEEFLDDATPQINVDFQVRLRSDAEGDINSNGLMCTHSAINYGEFWLERNGPSQFLYGEW